MDLQNLLVVALIIIVFVIALVWLIAKVFELESRYETPRSTQKKMIEPSVSKTETSPSDIGCDRLHPSMYHVHRLSSGEMSQLELIAIRTNPNLPRPSLYK